VRSLSGIVRWVRTVAPRSSAGMIRSTWAPRAEFSLPPGAVCLLFHQSTRHPSSSRVCDSHSREATRLSSREMPSWREQCRCCSRSVSAKERRPIPENGLPKYFPVGSTPAPDSSWLHVTCANRLSQWSKDHRPARPTRNGPQLPLENGGRAPQSARLPEIVTLDDGISETLPSRSAKEVRRP
jgi:hypothetical protein